MTPLELLASCHQDKVNDDDDDDDEMASPEDVISQVFSSLVLSLSSSNNTNGNGAPASLFFATADETIHNATSILEDITWRLGFHPNVSSCRHYRENENENQQQQEWNAALELIRLQLFQLESSSSSSSPSLSSSPPPSPRELLRTVVFHPYFVEQQQQIQSHTNHNGRCGLWWWCNVLGVLLVCHAVQSATRRVDSMRMEAIAFYQRHCLNQCHTLFISSSSSSSTMMTETAATMMRTLYWHLLFQYLVPSVLLPSSSSSLLQQEQEHDTLAIPVDPPSPLVACGVVCTLLDLVEMTTSGAIVLLTETQQQRKDELLWQCLQHHLPHVCRLDILLNHPTRSWEHSSLSDNNNTGTIRSREWFDCACHGNPDLVMNIQWNRFGLALLARFVWTKEQQQEHHHANHRRSPKDCWSVYFPHVAHLLCGPNTRINENDDDDDDDDVNENAQEWQRRKLVYGTKEGLKLLESLLVATESDPSTTNRVVPVVPWEHLEDHPMTNIIMSKSTTMADLMAHPLCPIGTVQLILNQVISSSSSSSQNKDRHEEGSIIATTGTRNTRHSYYLQLARSTLGRYRPMYQVECLHRGLIPNCPYPMLQPLLLDWMRPLGMRLADGDAHHTTTTTTTTTTIRAYLVSQVLHPLIQTWMDHENHHAHDPIHSNDESPIITTTTNTISTTKRLVQVDQLMEQMEFHVSAISLVRLFLLQEDDNDNTLRLGANATAQSYHSMLRALFQFNDVLESQLQRWSLADANNNDANTNESVAPPNFFKLYLLQDAIHELRDTAHSKISFMMD